MLLQHAIMLVLAASPAPARPIHVAVSKTIMAGVFNHTWIPFQDQVGRQGWWVLPSSLDSVTCDLCWRMTLHSVLLWYYLLLLLTIQHPKLAAKNCEGTVAVLWSTGLQWNSPPQHRDPIVRPLQKWTLHHGSRGFMTAGNWGLTKLTCELDRVGHKRIGNEFARFFQYTPRHDK